MGQTTIDLSKLPELKLVGSDTIIDETFSAAKVLTVQVNVERLMDFVSTDGLAAAEIQLGRALLQYITGNFEMRAYGFNGPTPEGPAQN